MADEYGETIILSVPDVIKGAKAKLLSEALKAYDGRTDVLLMSHVEMFSENLSAECSVVLVFNAEAIQGLLQKESV